MSVATWFRLLGLSCLLVGVVFAVPALTQDAKKGKKYALVVGVTEYDSKNFKDLKYADNDAEEMAKALLRPGNGFESVRVLTSKRGAKDAKDAPTAANIRKELKAMLAGKKKHDTVLVALAGHGVQLEVKDPQEKGESKQFTYFCPADASLLGVSYRTGHSDRLLPLDELFDGLGKCDAGYKLALIDACRNELQVKGQARRLDLGRVTIPDGVGAMFSCGRGQFAYETAELGGGHGVFFYYVLEGLKGKARNDEGEVSWDSLADYVKRQVTRNVPKLIGSGANQTPASMGSMEGESPVLVMAAPQVFTNGIGMQLKLIPTGAFLMGPRKEEKSGDHERPAHEVEITRAFYLGAYEVTQQEYEKVMGNNPSHFSATGGGKGAVAKLDTGRFPVEGVTWDEAVSFCKKLSDQPKEKAAGRVYRLPTEAEWEYACRAGTKTVFHFGNRLSAAQANFDGSRPYADSEKGPSLGRTCQVGSYRPNAWGLYDMHGNVEEWCADWIGLDYYRSSPKKDPRGPASGVNRVLRGGSWNYGGTICRASSRDNCPPNSRFGFVGFRIACEIAASR